jgi:hypothetical protein
MLLAAWLTTFKLAQFKVPSSVSAGRAVIVSL